MSKIISITEDEFVVTWDGWDKSYEGFIIEADDERIQVGISSGQQCCEEYGYLITNDEIKDFIGSTILSISVVDEVLNKKEIQELECLDCGEAMFVNLETSNGLLQLVAYNSHNGFYGHEAVLISKKQVYGKWV